jgi:D-xylose transport system ATP-binding protein
MVGREINELFPRQIATPGEVLLSVDRLTVSAAPKSEPVLEDITFDVRAGEVLGIGGLMGSGRTELLTHLFGAWGHRVSGAWNWRRRTPAAERALAARGDRPRIARWSAKTASATAGPAAGDRLQPVALHDRAHAARGLIDRNREFTRNKTFFDAMRIKAPDQETVVGTLSGGNQQKVVLGQGADDRAARDLPRRADARHRRGREDRSLRADQPSHRRRQGSRASCPASCPSSWA